MLKKLNKKHFLIAVIVLVGIVCLVLIFNKKEEEFQVEWGTINTEKESIVVNKMWSALESDENYRSYYGGCYLDKKNLIVLVTDEYDKAKKEVKTFLEHEESVIVREVEYTYLELQELQKEIWKKRDEFIEEGDEDTVTFLKDFVSSGIYEDKNRVEVSIVDLNYWKIIKFKMLFGNDNRIMFENSGGVFLD